jgi:copper chaperone
MTERKIIQVEGMACGGCEQSIQNAVGRLDGVERVQADHTTGRVEVTLDPTAVDDTTLRERITDAGYAVR